MADGPCGLHLHRVQFHVEGDFSTVIDLAPVLPPQTMVLLAKDPVQRLEAVELSFVQV